MLRTYVPLVNCLFFLRKSSQSELYGAERGVVSLSIRPLGHFIHIAPRRRVGRGSMLLHRLRIAISNTLAIGFLEGRMGRSHRLVAWLEYRLVVIVSREKLVQRVGRTDCSETGVLPLCRRGNRQLMRAFAPGWRKDRRRRRISTEIEFWIGFKRRSVARPLE